MDAEPTPWMILMRIVEICELQIRNTPDSLNENTTSDAESLDSDPNPLSIIQYVYSGGVGSVMRDEYNINHSQVAAVGREAKAEGNNFFQNASQHLSLLASELETLRIELKKVAQTPEEDLAVAAIGQARIEAENGNEEKSKSHLARAGKWALDTATSIGTQVAAQAIKTSMGL